MVGVEGGGGWGYEGGMKRWMGLVAVGLVGVGLLGGGCAGKGGGVRMAAPATGPTTQAATKPVVTLANPWRFRGEIEKLAAADAQSMPASGGIVFVGSSTVKGWKLDRAYGDLPVLNRGFGGSHTSDCVFFIDRVVFRYKPKVVVLFVGSNDLDAGKPQELVVDNVRRFAEMLRATLPETRLIYVAVKPSPSRPWNVGATREVNAKLAALAGEMGFVFVDPTAGLFGADGELREELYVKDKLHFSPAGYAVIDETVAPVVRKVWGEVKP